MGARLENSVLGIKIFDNQKKKTIQNTSYSILNSFILRNCFL